VAADAAGVPEVVLDGLGLAQWRRRTLSASARCRSRVLRMAFAAATLGTGSGPLICVEGRPSVAVGLLLQELLGAETVLRCHGDIDWAGLAIARSLIGAGAEPWRLSTSDYRRGLHHNSRQKRLPPPASPVTTPWDPNLADTMLEQKVAVEEEAVIENLLADLSSRQQ
jgi:uncharacterized protein (TIGR02679 family)